MNRRLATILVIFGIGFLILGAWWYYRSHFVPCASPDCMAPVDVVEKIAEGVVILQGKDGRVLVNERDGYQVDIENGLEVIYEDDTTVSIGAKERTLEAINRGYEVKIYEGISEDVDNWLDGWIGESNCPECYGAIKKTGEYYEVEDIGSMGIIINYFFKDNGKIFQITIFDSNIEINQLIEEINFYIL